MRWHSVMCAMSGITATAWTFPVRCLVSLRSTGSVRDVYMSNEQLVSDACTLLKVYLPALYRVATSNHTRVCLHSRELLSFPTLRVVCTCLYVCFMCCLCVPKSAVAGVAPHSGLFVYNYVYVILSVYVFVCTQVSCCWSHSTFRVVCI